MLTLAKYIMKYPLSALSTAAAAPTSSTHNLTPGFSRQNGAPVMRSKLVLSISSHDRESGELKKLGTERALA